MLKIFDISGLGDYYIFFLVLTSNFDLFLYFIYIRYIIIRICKLQRRNVLVEISKNFNSSSFPSFSNNPTSYSEAEFKASVFAYAERLGKEYDENEINEWIKTAIGIMKGDNFISAGEFEEYLTLARVMLSERYSKDDIEQANKMLGYDEIDKDIHDRKSWDF